MATKTTTTKKSKRAESGDKLQPLADRVVIRQVEQEQTRASGIVIPDTAKEKPQQGVIVAAGPGRLDDNGQRIPLDVAVGDRVLYKKYTGQEVKVDGEDLVVLQETEVLAKIY